MSGFAFNIAAITGTLSIIALIKPTPIFEAVDPIVS
jgi:hypothetical protein